MTGSTCALCHVIGGDKMLPIVCKADKNTGAENIPLWNIVQAKGVQ